MEAIPNVPNQDHGFEIVIVDSHLIQITREDGILNNEKVLTDTVSISKVLLSPEQRGIIKDKVDSLDGFSLPDYGNIKALHVWTFTLECRGQLVGRFNTQMFRNEMFPAIITRLVIDVLEAVPISLGVRY